MKNKIKSPIENSLRGIGKLGWTESGKMNSTLKRLEGSFENDKVSSLKSNKKEGKCSKCSFVFMSNNPSRVPDHKRRYHKYSSNSEDNLCLGSWSKLPTGKEIIDITSFCVSYTRRTNHVFNIGDKVIVDFTNLKHLYSDNIVFETEIQKITNTLIVLNDGSKVKSFNNLKTTVSPKLSSATNVITPLPAS